MTRPGLVGPPPAARHNVLADRIMTTSSAILASAVAGVIVGLTMIGMPQPANTSQLVAPAPVAVTPSDPPSTSVPTTTSHTRAGRRPVRPPVTTSRTTTTTTTAPETTTTPTRTTTTTKKPPGSGKPDPSPTTTTDGSILGSLFPGI